MHTPEVCALLLLLLLIVSLEDASLLGRYLEQRWRQRLVFCFALFVLLRFVLFCLALLLLLLKLLLLPYPASVPVVLLVAFGKDAKRST